MGFQCGIVGLPNVGKSTLFNALTSSSVKTANYPFCTIEPHVGNVAVPDRRICELVELIQPDKKIPAYMRFVDIAGLVAGAADGQGLGNQFLANIRETQAIIQVIRCFEDENIIHVSGKVDPSSDIEIINTELCLADQATVSKAIERLSKIKKSGDQSVKPQLEYYQLLFEHLNQAHPARMMSFSEEEQQWVDVLHLLTQKPMLYVANVEEKALHSYPWQDELTSCAERENAPLITVCSQLESEIAELDASERQSFFAGLGMEESGLDKIIRAGYHALGLHNFFTVGKKEVRAWTIPIDATAREAAGIIHSDFYHGFICAEVVDFDSFMACSGEKGAREAAKYRIEGKEYIVKDGDIILFKFSKSHHP